MEAATPKVHACMCTDQGRGCTGPGLHAGSGIRSVHVGGLVDQRRDQIHCAHGYEGLDRHTAGALFTVLSQPPACLPILPSTSIESAQSLGEMYRASWLTRSSTVMAR